MYCYNMFLIKDFIWCQLFGSRCITQRSNMTVVTICNRLLHGVLPPGRMHLPTGVHKLHSLFAASPEGLPITQVSSYRSEQLDYMN